MAKYYTKRYGQKKEPFLPFSWMNLILFLVSLFIIMIGYVALSIKPYNSFISLNVAPVLLVLGYVFMIPLSILYHKRDKSDSK